MPTTLRFALSAFLVALHASGAAAQPAARSAVTVYHRVAELEVRDTGRGPAATIPLTVAGSKGLKLAFVARAVGGITRVPLNMFDARAQDNTTALSYAWVDETWRPVLYRVDRFRYNGGTLDSRLAAETAFENVRFHGPPTPGQQGVLFVRNLVLYRGEDVEPPSAPAAPTAIVEGTGIRLAWSEPRDNVGVALYAVSRAGADGRFTKIAETAEPAFLDTHAPAGTSTYRVLAVDFQDNLSVWSAPVSASAPGGRGPARTQYEQDRLEYAGEIRRIHDLGAGKVVRGRVLQFGDSLSGAALYQLEAEAALGRYTVEARGRAGWTTLQGRGVIEQDLRELTPEFCLILYGTNNGKGKGANRAAMDDLRAMTSACAAAGAVPVVATIPPKGFTDPASRPEAEYNDALVSTFRAARTPVAYLFEALQQQPDRHTFLAGDGVHWDRQAFRLSAEVWRDVMAQVRFALLDRPQ